MVEWLYLEIDMVPPQRQIPQFVLTEITESLYNHRAQQMRTESCKDLQDPVMPRVPYKK